MADERHTSFMDALAALNRHYLVGVPEAREVWLIRHADAYAGLERLAEGRIDPPLSPVGEAQAAPDTRAYAKVAASEKRAEARAKGYEGEACGECGNFTLLRNGTCMKCDTCGSTTGCS